MKVDNMCSSLLLPQDESSQTESNKSFGWVIIELCRPIYSPLGMQSGAMEVFCPRTLDVQPHRDSIRTRSAHVTEVKIIDKTADSPCQYLASNVTEHLLLPLN